MFQNVWSTAVPVRTLEHPSPHSQLDSRRQPLARSSPPGKGRRVGVEGNEAKARSQQCHSHPPITKLISRTTMDAEFPVEVIPETIPVSHQANLHQPGVPFPSSPSPNALPPAYPSIFNLFLSAAHPQLLILYSYFALIAFLLHRAFTKSILRHTNDRWDNVKDARGKEVLLWSVLAVLSLGTTWNFMLKYFARSYADWLERAELSSLGVPALPKCPTRFGLSACYISLAASHFQRWSQWLYSTSLFNESWLLVVSNEANWWWSLEVCLYTVGPWTVFIYSQRRRSGIPHLWTYMLIGQTVAISFAACLFNLALALRPFPDGTMVQSAALRNASDDHASVVQEVELFEGNDRDKQGHEIIRTRSVNRLVLEPPSTHPSLASRLLLFALTLVAALSIYDRPTTLKAVLFMHLLPIALTLPHRWLHVIEEKIQHQFLNPTPGSDDEAGVHASNARVKGLLRPSGLLGLLTIYNLVVKVRSTLALLNKINSSVYFVDKFKFGSLRLLAHTLYPTTFYSHQAQSSISSDTVCLAVITMAFIAVDARRIWTQRSHLFPRFKKADSKPFLPRKNLPLVAVLLAVTTPLLGPSVTYAAWLALRENILETAEINDEKKLRRKFGEDVGLVVRQVEDEVTSIVKKRQ